MGLIKSRKIGIMGGTFDPIHYGHLLIAQSAAEEFDLDQVLFLPTGKAPHKEASEVTESKIRCDMVRLAIKDHPDFELSLLEAENSQINYTYLTLQKFCRIYQNASLYFIMGEDSLDDFSKWRKPEEICRLAFILVAVRNDGNGRTEEKIEHAKKIYHADMHMLHAPNFSISSKEIRERVRMGKSIRYMLPDEVRVFIKSHSLYIEQERDHNE